MSDERHQERMHRPSSRMARRKGRVRKSPPAPAEPEAQALPAEEEAAAPFRAHPAHPDLASARDRHRSYGHLPCGGSGRWLQRHRRRSVD